MCSALQRYGGLYRTVIRAGFPLWGHTARVAVETTRPDVKTEESWDSKETNK